jgi:hypothetical protein
LEKWRAWKQQELLLKRAKQGVHQDDLLFNTEVFDVDLNAVKYWSKP